MFLIFSEANKSSLNFQKQIMFLVAEPRVSDTKFSKTNKFSEANKTSLKISEANNPL